MSHRRVHIISDYARFGLIPIAFCRSCGHSAELDPGVIAEQLRQRGKNVGMAFVRRALRCSVCGAKRVDIRAREMDEARFPGRRL